MGSTQERLYQASRIVDGVAACLLDYVSCEMAVEFFDVLELVGRLDIAIEIIRSANGASD